jgi:hypothetical protein
MIPPSEENESVVQPNPQAHIVSTPAPEFIEEIGTTFF